MWQTKLTKNKGAGNMGYEKIFGLSRLMKGRFYGLNVEGVN